MRVTTALAGLAVSALALALLPSAPALAQDIQGCPDYAIIGARGTSSPGTEGEGLGGLAYATAQKLQAILEDADQTVDLAGVDYVANVFNLDLTHVRRSGGYQASADAGQRETERMLEELESNCGTAPRAILIGYSQGGEVIDRTAERLDPELTPIIAAAITYGDPTFNVPLPLASRPQPDENRRDQSHANPNRTQLKAGLCESPSTTTPASNPTGTATKNPC